MARTTMFRRLDQLFTSRIRESAYAGQWGSHQVHSVALAHGIFLQRAEGNEQVYWYEVVFPEGDRICVWPGVQLSCGDTEILEAVLHENGV